MNNEEIDLMVHMGDLVDTGADLEEEFSYLETIQSVYNSFRGERHVVIGNHDMAKFSKEEFLTN